MALSLEVTEKIKTIVTQAISNKLEKYNPETAYSPFFDAMFGKKTVVTASITHSLYTSFGMSIYEQIAVILAESQGLTAVRQHKIIGSVDDATALLIKEACSKNWDTPKTIAKIRKTVKQGKRNYHKDSTVDVFVTLSNGVELYVDITTVKPNLKEFRTMREKLLTWAALRLSIDKNAKIDARIGIPYNPYYPEPYARWTSSECDVQNDLLIQNDLWAAFAGSDVFDSLVLIFTEIGEKYKENLNELLS